MGEDILGRDCFTADGQQVGTHPEQARLGFDLLQGCQDDNALRWIVPTRADEPRRSFDAKERLDLKATDNDFLRQLLWPVEERGRKPVGVALEPRIAMLAVGDRAHDE